MTKGATKMENKYPILNKIDLPSELKKFGPV